MRVIAARACRLACACVFLAGGHACTRGDREASGAGASAGAVRRVDLAGTWKYLPYDGEANMALPGVDDAAWPSMDLPSSWFLLGRKQYPVGASADAPSPDTIDPGALKPIDRDKGLDYAGTVWFRRSFDWDGDATRPVVVDFDMVDYYASVFVNGVAIGRHEGYFQHWSLDATSALHRGKNDIAARVSAPSLPFDMAQEYPLSFPKSQDQVKGIFAYHDTRPGATSRRGQERSTGGILRGVAVRQSSGVDLAELVVTPLDVSATSARLVVEATLHNWTATEQRAAVDGVVRGATFADGAGVPVHLAVSARPGLTRTTAEVRIDRPHLWWAWDYGRPDLYELNARVTAESPAPGSASAAIAGGLLDERSVRFGIRSITRGDDSVFRLNGQRVYPRGTNYIATQWLSQADAAFYARDLRLMIGANLNAVRVHAHLERPEFYDLADELGIMVWQDFPLQWGYTDSRAFHDVARAQAEDMIRQYGDHPSIVLWCMHNESPHAMEWMQKRAPDQNRELDEQLAALARSLDPSRVVHRDSGTGDAHIYFGWYDGNVEDVATAEVEPLVTEYGAASLPGLDTLRTMFDAESLWPDTPRDWESWQFADFQAKETFRNAGIKQGRTINEFIANTQRYQAVAVRFTTEVLRRRKWAGNTGVYQFMFVDDWPSITWSVVDYYRRPKLAYAALALAMQRVLPSLEYDPRDPGKPIALHVVNDLLKPLERARVHWRATSPRQRDVEGSREIDVPADAVVRVADLGRLDALASRTGRLEVRVESATGELLGHAELGPDDFLDRK
jgi:beta-mannosidase